MPLHQILSTIHEVLKLKLGLAKVDYHVRFTRLVALVRFVGRWRILQLSLWSIDVDIGEGHRFDSWFTYQAY